LKGGYVKVANTFSDEEVLNLVQHGWEMTDVSIEYGHPAMSTNQPWQVLLWALSYPGKVYMHINGININEEGISIKWHLIANDHRAKSRGEIVEEVKRLSIEGLKAFLASVIWGDGYVNVGGKYVRLVMGLSKYERYWLGIIKRMIDELGFIGPYMNEYRIEVEVRISKAIKLARAWFEIPDIRELVELGAGLPDGEKLKRMIELANMEVREIGKSSINVPGTDVKMNIRIRSDYEVELRAWRRDRSKALRLIEELRNAGYNPIMYVDGEGYTISITHSKVKSDERLRKPVCELLYRWLNETSNEKRRVRIVAAMRNLECLNDT
ncbi:hypothetical protein, partial [Caldivirga sp.]|uniref:hypothetical protein n=1 Tax=Caldivirga sp. TaxID=2080243 RepID=UPI0025BCB95D